METKQAAWEAEYREFAKEHGISEQEAQTQIDNAQPGVNPKVERLRSRSVSSAQDQILLSIGDFRKAISSKQTQIENADAELGTEVHAQTEKAAKTVKSIEVANGETVHMCKSTTEILLSTLHDVITDGMEASSPVVTRTRQVISATQVRKHSVDPYSKHRHALHSMFSQW